MNLEGEMVINGRTTSLEFIYVDGIPAQQGIDYIIDGNGVRFLRSGTFTFDLTNLNVHGWHSVYVHYSVSVLETVAQPRFTPFRDTVSSGTKVSIYCATESAKIYYTLDGSEPSDSSLLYESPFELTASSTIKAIATKEGFINSDVATASYIVKDPDPNVSNAVQNRLAAFRAYPNPCGETLYLKRDGEENAANITCFRLLDLQGSERLRLRGDASQIDMSQLPAGVYVLEATDGNGAAFRHKIVKR
ncbi:MAG: chitobiase/beta-hexosaminidase C-terminal domain-containing protein [Bacteroides sp.]|nr:chitobiase/beta-hexosaminidase C-terminal domain-containing protein [Ruminococcus flavefaciens]MCM1555439.1 chitobiase/beta-hexosaminidase C-terminal domain-containing protein [Bacteroides sp.]